MDLISKTDALDKVHKTIENLIFRLPRVRGADGEDYCSAPASLASYNMAYAEIRREIQNISSWHTEDPEESGEYLVTYEFTYNGKVHRKITIAEWATHSTNCDGAIIEFGEWFIDLVGDVVAWMPLPDKYEGEV